jgi:hypothetical protein
MEAHEDHEGENGFACGASPMELNFNNNHAGAAYSPRSPS